MWENGRFSRQREQNGQRSGGGKTVPGRFLVVVAQEARVGKLKWGRGVRGEAQRRLDLT